MNESERSLNAKANSQLHAIKTTMKKTLTAASRRQYSGLDFKKRACREYRCILHPRSRFRRWWDILILILLLMNLVLMPLHLGFFRLPGIEWQFYSLFSDFMFFADMMLNFRTGIDDRKQGIVIMDPVQIRRHYLKGWFPVDLVSSLPLDFLVLNWPAQYRNMDRRSTLSQLAKLISFVKLIKISRLFRYGGRTEQIMFYQTTGVYLQLGNILALIFLAVHWHACLQFFVGSLMGFPPKSWISIANLQYSWAVHNTVSLMMTNSYGVAQKTGLLIEEWIQVMGMFFGALWQALLLGYGANLLAHKDYTKNVQRERMQEVEEFMSYYDLPERLRVRIRSHLNAQAMFLNDKDILSSLSGTLRELRAGVALSFTPQHARRSARICRLLCPARNTLLYLASLSPPPGTLDHPSSGTTFSARLSAMKLTQNPTPACCVFAFQTKVYLSKRNTEFCFKPFFQHPRRRPFQPGQRRAHCCCIASNQGSIGGDGP
ncbi:hypothetical protein HPB51_023006 [Rhipicephalus microplus]|uniref:Ion transport domain-containing protein n=1 Tax=Rhipicephalus microplus TaxID=6941 RepID=A0A9J6D6Y7_RHIMP|nr:hypothetical protein HPB51_023006 [Rhipicephalus microplus]